MLSLLLPCRERVNTRAYKTSYEELQRASASSNHSVEVHRLTISKLHNDVG
jgi:hypothetical protein